MSDQKLMISPKTRVGELLDAYPALEQVLLEISPVFAKLKNPVLRRTVAKIATLQQAAVIGNMPVEDLVNRLRSSVGQDQLSGIGDQHDYLSASPPVWYHPEAVLHHFDASVMINRGDNPMNEVLSHASRLTGDQIFELVTPFVPAPIIGILSDKGFQVWSRQSAGQVSTYIYKSKEKIQ